MYDVNLDYISIIAGTSNTIHPAFMEASKNVNAHNSKGAAHLKNFLEDIENLATQSGVKDKRISDSKGNIHNFQGYKDINSVLKFLRKNLGKVEGVNDCDKVLSALERLIPQYEQGYSKQIRLIILEYESAVYILVTSLAMFMATKMDFVADGEQIIIKKKNEPTHGVIEKTLKGMADILSKSEHKDYLDDLVEASEKMAEKKEIKESTDFMESAVSEGLALIDAILTNTTRIVTGIGQTFTMLKRTMFGIIPLIRSCIYLKYKKKADTILALEAEAAFIDKNIEQLQNRTNMDEKKRAVIVKKQAAAAEAKRKKAAKLRAQLMETEKDTSKALAEHDKDMKRLPEPDKKSESKSDKKSNNNDDGDLVLEMVQKVYGVS